MPKAKSEKKSAKLRHTPLAAEMERAANPPLAQKSKKREGRDGDDFLEDGTIEEMSEAPQNSVAIPIARDASATVVPLSNNSDDDYEDDVDDEEDGDDGGYYVTATEGFGLDTNEESVVNRFLNAGRAESRTLADIILEKLNNNAAANADADADDDDDAAGAGDRSSSLPPKVVEVYTAVGALLAHYKSGKVPKALKMLPHLRNWEDVLWITRPDTWSPGATFVCTRIFASNLNQRMSQRFYNLVLLEKVRNDIQTHGKLNYHLYMSLKKALYKPASFYKGLLLPLAQGGDCTLKEATIIGSVLAKVSIPMNHSAAALLRLCEMKYTGTTSLFIKILVNKKYSLPRKVIDGLVSHFASFLEESRQMPVIWHQSLLVFAQRYKLEISDDQRELLRVLLKAQSHHQITTEIRRELFNSQNEKRMNPHKMEY
eukprot:GSChrysophyteH1.ASY1.ANO1.3041.1 assembled CDS